MSAGVAGRPLVGCDLSITDWVGSSGGDFQRLLLAQTVALELQAMRVVDDAVEDGVGKGGSADHIVPAVDWELTGDQGSAAAVAFFGDLEQVMTLFGTEGSNPVPSSGESSVRTGDIGNRTYLRHG